MATVRQKCVPVTGNAQLCSITSQMAKNSRKRVLTVEKWCRGSKAVIRGEKWVKTVAGDCCTMTKRAVERKHAKTDKNGFQRLVVVENGC